MATSDIIGTWTTPYSHPADPLTGSVAEVGTTTDQFAADGTFKESTTSNTGVFEVTGRYTYDGAASLSFIIDDYSPKPVIVPNPNPPFGFGVTEAEPIAFSPDAQNMSLAGFDWTLQSKTVGLTTINPQDFVLPTATPAAPTVVATPAQVGPTTTLDNAAIVALLHQ